MRITAVLACYNGAASIGEAIRSALNQTHPPDEIIVVDDGSTDETRSVVSSFGASVRYIVQENQGPGAARNTGVKAATGDWIAFLDHDDWWRQNKLACQVDAIVQCPGAVVCYTGCLCQFRSDASSAQSDHHARPADAVSSDSLWPLLRYSNPIALSSTMVRRDIFLLAQGFNTEIRFGEDWDLWVRIHPLGKFVAVPGTLTAYNHSGGGLSSNPELAVSCIQQLVDGSLTSDLSGFQRFVWRRRILALQFYKAAMSARTVGRNNLGLKLMLRSVLLWPSPKWQPFRFATLGAAMRDFVLEHTTRSKSKSDSAQQ